MTPTKSLFDQTDVELRAHLDRGSKSFSAGLAEAARKILQARRDKAKAQTELAANNDRTRVKQMGAVSARQCFGARDVEGEMIDRIAAKAAKIAVGRLFSKAEDKPAKRPVAVTKPKVAISKSPAPSAVKQFSRQTIHRFGPVGLFGRPE